MTEQEQKLNTTLRASDKAPPSNEAPPGDGFSARYEIDRQIGSGGMGSVYLGRLRSVNKHVAIKRIPADIVDTDEKKTRLKVEAQAVSALNHPNIVTLHDFGWDETGAPYLVMEYVQGETLTALISRQKVIDAQLAAEICIQVCDALEHAHARGVIHRDLKPSNIMIVSDGGRMTVKLVDFGLAKMAKPPGESVDGVTRTGAIVGSPEYMSPEQCFGHQLDARSDLYSLGCVLFEMLHGHKLFTGDTVMGIALQHIHAKPKLSNTLPPAFRQILLRALAKDADHRYRNAAEMREDLLRARDGLPLVPRARGAGVATKTVIGSALALVAIVGLVAFQIGHKEAGPGPSSKPVAPVVTTPATTQTAPPAPAQPSNPSPPPQANPTPPQANPIPLTVAPPENVTPPSTATSPVAPTQPTTTPQTPTTTQTPAPAPVAPVTFTIENRRHEPLFTSTSAKTFGEALQEAMRRKVSLHGAQLFGQTIKNVDLSGIDLAGADLRQSIWDTVNLSGADLSDAEFYNVECTRVTLDNARLAGTGMSGQFWSSSIKNVNFDQSRLEGRDYVNVDFTGSTFNHTYLGQSGFTRCNFSGTRWDTCKFFLLRGCNFAGATLTAIDFSDLNEMRDCDFTGATVDIKVPPDPQRTHNNKPDGLFNQT